MTTESWRAARAAAATAAAVSPRQRIRTPFQNLPNRGQMTGARLQGHRPNMLVKKHSNPAQVEKAQAEAIRLLQN